MTFDAVATGHQSGSFRAKPNPLPAALQLCNFHQTIHVLACLTQLTAFFGLGFLCASQFGAPNSTSLDILLLAFAVLGLTVAFRQISLQMDPHPLAFRRSTPWQAAMFLASGFATLIAVQAVLQVQAISWQCAWATAAVMFVLAVRFAVEALGWGIGYGRIAVFGPEDATVELCDTLRGRSRCPVTLRLQNENAGSWRELQNACRDAEVDTVVLTCISSTEQARIVSELAHLPVGIYVTPEFCPASAPLPPLVQLLPNLTAGPGGLEKRAIDLICATLLLATFAPLFVLVALAIKLTSPGPVFFRQVRFGLGCEEVLVWKFRTMRSDLQDISGERRTTARDSRVTSVGRVLRRLSIDELPQLINVVAGDMSLVGPRPHATKMKVEGQIFGSAVETYPLRHRMKPGITGWAQVNGSRGEVDTLAKARRRVNLDLWYIANWSVGLDVRIILRTALGGFATLSAD
ncbi:exopolysaccharide biosynthesis polyprenyl glycosylphosphotransferase [Teichococcus aestuarii]|nr:exopolysaccharide biosynthesis polyprenyl glycosylphosphotransferase [Pseudoroseomonas aestuarii]